MSPLIPRVALLAAALIATVFAGCGNDSSAPEDRVAVVATTTHVADIARAVGGDRVDVTQLLQPNSDPHDYEPRPQDVRAVAAAEVMLASGLDLDGWIAAVAEQSGGDATPIELGAHLPVEREGEAHDHAHDEEEGEHDEGHGVDPHWWHDPRNATAVTERVRDALVAADPEHADDYRAAAAAYARTIEALDADIERCIESVPVSERKLVTDHDAFGYFADRYDIEVVGAVIPSQTTQAQPNARDLAELAAVVKREKVKAIFPESSLSPKLAQALADQAGITSEYTLYGDSLGPKKSSGTTYLAMLAANADAMVRGFTGGVHSCEPARSAKSGRINAFLINFV